jgi:CRP-like cAMP-binding protein
MNTSEMEQALAKCQFFKGIDPKGLLQLVPLCKTQEYRAGEPIFQQGDFGEHLYVVVDGQVILERAIDLGARKGTVTIDTLGRGRLLGCWSTLLNEAHVLMSTAVCQKPTRVLVIRGADMRSLMMNEPQLGLTMMERLCFLLRDRIQAAYGALEKI